MLRFRHWLYDAGVLKSVEPSVKTICIGNLEFGGTGKTPHVMWLLNHLLENGYTPAYLSRGYGRNSTGFAEVHINSFSAEVGDEALMVKLNFPATKVVVCENRLKGVQLLKQQSPDIDVVVLDDAFQHRQIKPGISILLTPANFPFNQNALFPAGSLRDVPQSAKRASLIIHTQNNQKIDYPVSSVYEMKEMIPISQLAQNQPVKAWKNIVALCGLANNSSFLVGLSSYFNVPRQEMEKNSLLKKDHEHFNDEDFKKLQRIISTFAAGSVAIITTEKDAARFKGSEFEQMLLQFPVYVSKIDITFTTGEHTLKQWIKTYLNT